MAWSNAVITNKGLEMLRQAIDGRQMTIVSASGSDDTYPAASLMVQTSPANEKQTFAITEIKDMDNGKRIRVTITNEGLATGYVMKQLCVWAKVNEEEAPQIIVILQDEVGTPIPAEGEIASYLMQFYVLLKVDRATNMQIIVENPSYVTYDAIEGLLDEKLDKTDAFSGSYTDLENVPGSFTPSAHSHSFNNITEKPETYPPSEHTHSGSNINQDSTHRFVSNSEKTTWNGKADEKTFNVTVPSSSWSTSGDVKYKQVSVSGLLVSDNPIAGVAYGTDTAANEQYTEAFGCIEHIKTYNGYIRAYTAKDGDVPKVNIPIVLKVVR